MIPLAKIVLLIVLLLGITFSNALVQGGTAVK